MLVTYNMLMPLAPLDLHFIENKTAHIKEAYRGVCGKRFLHIAVNNAVGIINLCNAQMIFVLVQMMINGILFPLAKERESQRKIFGI